jgi:hypothetical protein
VDDLAAQRLLDVDEQVMHLGDRVELARPLHQQLLAVGAAPREDIEPRIAVQPHQLGSQQRGTQALGFGDRSRSDLEQRRNRLLRDAGAEDLKVLGHRRVSPFSVSRRYSPHTNERQRAPEL